LHIKCLIAWCTARKADAVSALTAMGIRAPGELDVSPAVAGQYGRMDHPRHAAVGSANGHDITASQHHRVPAAPRGRWSTEDWQAQLDGGQPSLEFNGWVRAFD
jgi:hypothetical protein